MYKINYLTKHVLIKEYVNTTVKFVHVIEKFVAASLRSINVRLHQNNKQAKQYSTLKCIIIIIVVVVCCCYYYYFNCYTTTIKQSLYARTNKTFKSFDV